MTLAPNIHDLFNSYAEKRHQKLRRDLDDLLKILDSVCESPVEQIFLLNFIDQFDEAYYCLEHPCQVVIPIGHEIGGKSYDLVIFPQYTIATKNQTYRVDFMVMLNAAYLDPSESLLIKADRFYVLVEIDGHDFHEKTKQQAQRDKSRDRDLQESGYKVFHYTGSEIFKGSAKIVWQLHDILIQQRNDFAHKGQHENKIT